MSKIDILNPYLQANFNPILVYNSFWQFYKTKKISFIENGAFVFLCKANKHTSAYLQRTLLLLLWCMKCEDMQKLHCPKGCIHKTVILLISIIQVPSLFPYSVLSPWANGLCGELTIRIREWTDTVQGKQYQIETTAQSCNILHDTGLVPMLWFTEPWDCLVAMF